jgi:t-SNARE complex subunit (syntaxin)
MEEIKPSFEVNIVKSNYSNITESKEVVKAKAARRNKWSVFIICLILTNHLQILNLKNLKN